ncbi:MAG: hypothetical protein HYX91_05360 [Chloroflexi bacterium]|nr:hypothetical protein [Chloroflexota bacterium]
MRVREGFLKTRCLKCGGNLYLDRDLYGWYRECLQCGRTSYIETLLQAPQKVEQEPADLKYALT